MPTGTAAADDRPPVVVAGAGIGGLTAALALARAGFRVIVAERAAELSTVGAGIQIAPNAGRVLAGLGLDGAIAGAAIEPRAIDVHNGLTGRRLALVPAAAFRERYGFPYRVIHRADLQSLLADAVARTPTIALRLGTSVAGASEAADGLSVHLTQDRGNETVEAAALVAADGVRSALRAFVPGAAPARPTGRTAWRAVVHVDGVRQFIDAAAVGLWLGPDAHLVHYPVAHGTAVNIVAIVEESWDAPGWDAPGDPTAIAARFAAWCGPVRKLVGTPDAWRKFALAAVDAHGPWAAGRLALLGDAAHAMMPFLAQGAAMAIEDAAVLANALQATGDVPAALRAYQTARRKRVLRVAEASRRTGDAYHFGSMLAAARDAALALAGPRLILGQNDWIYRWQPPDQPMRATNFGK